MTEEQCRAIEALHFNGGQCNWPKHQIEAAIRRWSVVCDRLAAGGKIDISEDMGSCQCGDTSASVSLRDGTVWCESTGRMNWQIYNGPADRCRVPYSVGVRARQIAAAWAAVRGA